MLPQVRGDMRRSQLIVPFGVGAIVNLRDESVMACSIDLWDQALRQPANTIHDRRLEERLHVDSFVMPPSESEAPAGIPFVRFPRWLFCPRCRRFRPVKQWRQDWLAGRTSSWDVPRCTCTPHGVKLVPSRFVVICPRGHIDDFPWVKWVHHNAKVCAKPDIRLRTGAATAGLGGIRVECATCRAATSMAGTFETDFFRERFPMRCTGNKPWARSSESCEAYPRTVQRGGSNVYFPQVISSIHIPPYSDRISLRVQRSPEWQILRSRRVDEHAATQLIEGLAQAIGCTTSDVRRHIALLSEGAPREVDRIAYRHQEFQAFDITPGQEPEPSPDFEIQVRPGTEYGLHGIRKVILVTRLREIRALVAFSRLAPLDRDELGLDENERPGGMDVRPVPVSDDETTDWLPAVEVRGEGIFVALDDDGLEEWASRDAVRTRLARVNQRLRERCLSRGLAIRQVNAQFILLHTLAHLLIRRFSFECGYASAALRERIYCSETSDRPPMNGILIYTAAGDASGTLGGLVRQGLPDVLPDIFAGALDDARWCSSDPLCIESSGQGRDGLNLGACHACALLPETSCEEFNVLLDRGLVIGTPGNAALGFFGHLR